MTEFVDVLGIGKKMGMMMGSFGKGKCACMEGGMLRRLFILATVPYSI